MRSLLSRATQVDPSFSVGLGLIVILAVAEILAATFYYVGGVRAARTSTQAITATVVRPPASAASATPAPVPQSEFSSKAAAPTPAPSLVDPGTGTAVRVFVESGGPDPGPVAG